MPRCEFIFVGTGEGFTSVSCLRMHVIEPTQTWVTHAGNHTSTSGKMGESPPASLLLPPVEDIHRETRCLEGKHASWTHS